MAPIPKAVAFVVLGILTVGVTTLMAVVGNTSVNAPAPRFDVLICQ